MVAYHRRSKPPGEAPSAWEAVLEGKLGITSSAIYVDRLSVLNV